MTETTFAICPPLARGECLPGSTDVADASWATPTACSVACCAPLGTAGSELLLRPEVLAQAREEFNHKTA